MQLVGYGHDEKDGDYWLVRNSWDATWGENGYIRLKRSSAAECGTDTEPKDLRMIFPILKRKLGEARVPGAPKGSRGSQERTGALGSLRAQVLAPGFKIRIA